MQPSAARNRETHIWMNFQRRMRRLAPIQLYNDSIIDYSTMSLFSSGYFSSSFYRLHSGATVILDYE